MVYTVQKNSMLQIVKIFFVLLLILIPVKLNADSFVPGTITGGNLNQDWPSIISQIQEANKKSPNNPQMLKSLANAYNNYGLALMTQKHWQEAEDYLQQAVATDPDNATIKKNLSNVYTAHGFELFKNDVELTYTSYLHTASKQLATQAIALNPANAGAYILLGDVEYENQNLDAAKTAWQNAKAIMPDDPGLNQRLDKITREASTEANMDTKYNMYFVIKVDPALEKLAGFDINEAVDTARMDVSGELDFHQNFKIPVLVYTSQTYNFVNPDAPDWSTGIFDGKIRVILTQYKNNISLLKSTIIHEYTHAAISNITNNNIPRWFNEGIAKYMEYKFGIPPRINYLAEAYTGNEIIAFNDLNTNIVSPNINKALLAYQQSFNFVYYLVERYGMTKLRALLDLLGTGVEFENAMNQIYQVPLTTLERNWSLWLPDFIEQWAEAPIPQVSE